MEALTFTRRGHSTIESIQKENKDTDANRFAGFFVGGGSKEY